MKKLFLLSLWLVLARLASAQVYAGGTLLDNAKAEHYLLASPSVNKKKEIGFTIECAGLVGKVELTNAAGEPLLFNSLAAAFDFFFRQDWAFCTALTDTNGFSDGPVGTTTTYLFQRRK